MASNIGNAVKLVTYGDRIPWSSTMNEIFRIGLAAAFATGCTDPQAPMPPKSDGSCIAMIREDVRLPKLKRVTLSTSGDVPKELLKKLKDSYTPRFASVDVELLQDVELCGPSDLSIRFSFPLHGDWRLETCRSGRKITSKLNQNVDKEKLIKAGLESVFQQAKCAQLSV